LADAPEVPMTFQRVNPEISGVDSTVGPDVLADEVLDSDGEILIGTIPKIFVRTAQTKHCSKMKYGY
jgi:hypothetical protein